MTAPPDSPDVTAPPDSPGVAAPPDSISRPSLAVAGTLGILGLLRLATDMLTDARPHWASALDGTAYRYLVRAGTDGSLAGDLNVAWFKLLAIPCGVAVAWFLNLLLAGSLTAADRRWTSPRGRIFVLGSLAAICTLIEVEKATALLGLGLTGLLPGETPVGNHIAHAVSLVLGALLMTRLRYRPR